MVSTADYFLIKLIKIFFIEDHLKNNNDVLSMRSQ